MISNQPELFNQLYLCIKGVLADSTIALSFIVIAIYFNHEVINKLILILLTVNNLIINVDIFHFYRYALRLNSFFHKDYNWLNFIHAERNAFAIILGFNFVLYYFGNRLVSKTFTIKRNKLKLIVFTTIILHLTQALPTNFPDNKENSWDSYFLHQNIYKNIVPHYSSAYQWIYRIFTSPVLEPIDIFSQSSFFQKAHEKFFTTAELALNKFKPDSKDKIWSHSGFKKDYRPNSSKAAIAAIRNGYKGIEIDIRFSKAINKIVICHDFLPEEKLKLKQSLKEFLQELGTDISKLKYLWLDFKNINFYNFDQSLKLIQKANQSIPEHIELFIETRDAFISRMLVQNGYKTIFGIGYGDPLFNFYKEKAKLYRSLIVLSRCSLISLPDTVWEKISKNKILGNFPVCIYTVDDKNKLNDLVKDKTIVGILTNLELSINEIFQ
jgi:hypothetical protein